MILNLSKQDLILFSRYLINFDFLNITNQYYKLFREGWGLFNNAIILVDFPP